MITDVEERLAQDTKESLKRKNFTNGLRALADFLDAHPTVPLPTPLFVTSYCYDKQTFLDTARQLKHSEKAVFGGFFEVRRKFAEDLRFDVSIPRNEVCEKVVTGTRLVPARSIPEHEEEIVEWKCPESIFKD